MPRLRGFQAVSNDSFALHPIRATEGSAGYDLFAPSHGMVLPQQSVLVWLNIKAYMLIDEVFKVYPRSSMGLVGVTFANSVGIIDHDYFDNEKTGGNIGLLLTNNGEEAFFFDQGQAIGQGMFHKLLFADIDMVRKPKRTGGFGSTDEVRDETTCVGDIDMTTGGM